MNASEDFADILSVGAYPMAATAPTSVPTKLIVMEIDFGAGLNPRCRMRGRFDLTTALSAEQAIKLAAGGSSAAALSADDSLARRWTVPVFRRPNGGRRVRALSLNSNENIYVAILLHESIDHVQFSSEYAPFNAGSADAAKQFHQPINVIIEKSGAVSIGNPGAPAPAVDPYDASDGRQARMAYFAANAVSYPAGVTELPFNIVLEAVGRVRTAPGEWTIHRTPIIIDPDLRYPPVHGGIPTEP